MLCEKQDIDMGSTEMKNDLAKGPARAMWSLASSIPAMFTRRILKMKKEPEQKISLPDETAQRNVSATKALSHLRSEVGRYLLS